MPLTPQDCLGGLSCKRMEKRKNKTIQGISPLLSAPCKTSPGVLSTGISAYFWVLDCAESRLDSSRKEKMASQYQFRGTSDSIFFNILPSPMAAFAWRQGGMYLLHLALNKNPMCFIHLKNDSKI